MLYSPGVHDLATIKTVVSALKKPFNLVMGFADPTLTSINCPPPASSASASAARCRALRSRPSCKCAREMKDKGSFTYVRGMAPIKELREAFAAV